MLCRRCLFGGSRASIYTHQLRSFSPRTQPSWLPTTRTKTRTLTTLSPHRPTLLTPPPTAPDLLPKPTTHPALTATQLRNGPRDTYNPSHRVRKRRVGFLARKRTRTGRAILVRRLRKGRRSLTH